MRKNNGEEFFSTGKNVISVLDGDQKDDERYKDEPNILFLPFESIEKKLVELYDNDSNNDFFKGNKVDNRVKKAKRRNKKFFDIMERIYLQNEIFQFITESDKLEVEKFKSALQKFINQ